MKRSKYPIRVADRILYGHEAVKISRRISNRYTKGCYSQMVIDILILISINANECCNLSRTIYRSVCLELEMCMSHSIMASGESRVEMLIGQH